MSQRPSGEIVSDSKGTAAAASLASQRNEVPFVFLGHLHCGCTRMSSRRRSVLDPRREPSPLFFHTFLDLTCMEGTEGRDGEDPEVMTGTQIQQAGAPNLDPGTQMVKKKTHHVFVALASS